MPYNTFIELSLSLLITITTLLIGSYITRFVLAQTEDSLARIVVGDARECVYQITFCEYSL